MLSQKKDIKKIIYFYRFVHGKMKFWFIIKQFLRKLHENSIFSALPKVIFQLFHFFEYIRVTVLKELRTKNLLCLAAIVLRE